MHYYTNKQSLISIRNTLFILACLVTVLIKYYRTEQVITNTKDCRE